MSKRKANNSWWAQNAKRVKRDSLIGGNSEGAGYIISFDTSKKRDAVRQCYSLFNEYVEKLNFGTTKKEEIEEEEEEIEDIEDAINKQAAQLKEKQDFKFTSIDIGVRGMSFISCDLVALGIKDAPQNDTTKSESENQIESNPVEKDQKAETKDALTKDDSNNNKQQQENTSNNNPTEPSKVEFTEQQKACIDFPVSFLRSIFTDLAKEGKQKTKHIHRVIPLQLLCRANEEEILKNVSSLVEIYFGSVRKIDDNDGDNNNNNNIKEGDTINDNGDNNTNKSSKGEATKNGDTNPSKNANEEPSNEETVNSNNNEDIKETQTEDIKETQTEGIKETKTKENKQSSPQAPTLSKRELAKQRPIRKNAFSIHYKCRNNNKIKKDTIRKKIFSLVPKEFVVDLYKPNNVIIVEIFQTVCGISVIMDYPELYDLRIRNATKLKE